jgi:hypothetical protein
VDPVVQRGAHEERFVHRRLGEEVSVAAWEEWTFTSSLTRPDGVKFEVVCTVSPEQYGDDFPELSEITQMAIARIATDLRNNDRIKNRGVVKIMERPRGPRVPTSGLRYMDEVTNPGRGPEPALHDHRP